MSQPAPPVQSSVNPGNVNSFISSPVIGGGQIATDVLPAAASVAPGTFGYDTVVGAVVARGGNWSALAPEVFAPLTLTTAGIIAAAVAAQVAGGGIVQLPGVTITVTSSLPLLPGVIYRGVGYNVNNAGNIPTLSGGTIVQAANTTFPVFAGNATDLGAQYANFQLLLLSQIVSCGVQNMGIVGGSYGIKCGALYQGGCIYGQFNDLFLQGSINYGLYLENIEQTCVERINAYSHGHGIGVIASGTNLWNMGNSHFRKLAVNGSTTNGNGRAALFQSRGGSSMNNIIVVDFGASGISYTNTQAATMANTSTAIGVADLSQYGVGMPINFSATANGFTGTQIYFVLSMTAASGAGSITVGNYTGGLGGSVAIAATGSTAVNIVTHGWPLLEFSGADAGSTITYCSVTGASDIEIGGTAHIVFNSVAGMSFESGIIHSVISTCDVCIRNCAAQQFSFKSQTQGLVTDFDGNAQYVRFDGPSSAPFSANFAGIGVLQTGTSGRGALNLGGTSSPDLFIDGNFFNQLRLQNALALKFSQQPASHTIATGDGNLITFSTAAGGSIALPNLSSVNLIGWLVIISNPQANPVTVTASQNIVGQGASAASATLATLTNGMFLSMNNAGTMYWARIA